MSPKQKKLAAKAPPPNKIDEKDFAVLRAEKAKGRGMGLQDEKVQPGKVMKARVGRSIDAKKYMKSIGVFPKVSSGAGGKGSGTGGRDTRTITEKGQFIKRRKELAGVTQALKATRIGKIALGVGAPGVAAQQYLKSKMKKKDEPKKKMGGGMMKKYSKGGGSDMGKSPTSKMKVAEIVRTYALANSMKDKDRLTDRDIDMAKKAISRVKAKRAQQGFLRTDPMPKKMGGGMMQKPMGYSKGTSVTVKCKLGRNKPTKIT